MKEPYQRRQKLSASLTVEASYVMAMVIMALSILIQTAYRECRKTTEVMKLHQTVERIRYQEEKQDHVFSNGQVSVNSNQVEGLIHTDTWEKQIIAKVYEPEELLRKISVLEWEESN